ncbi:amidohydrolase family protein [Roseomonas sp. AR75]|uniref:amidohydrolase family protein n=1 Tax=Roseomonas sp. AR75 TaxID=2562311 RepID=UPI0010C05F3C|nr:amidohydrolase family protein [Roseomonas sp. AR75]
MSDDILAIDTVVNPLTPEIVASRPAWSGNFHTGTFKQESTVRAGYTKEAMLAMLDEAGIGRAFLVAAKIGQLGLQGSWHLDPAIVADLVQWRPERFSGLVGLDPTQGMPGVRELRRWVRDHGFIGAHGYPHWFELPPDHAKWYPFYAECCELGVPVQLQVGQSLVYDPARPLRSVGRPITLDSVACDFPELKLVGIHIGIPWHDEMIAMAWKHRNVFIVADAHAPKHWPESFVRYIDSYGQDKVMFGTDFPVLMFRRMREEVAALGLRPGPLRKFLRDNALRVYGLGQGG